MSVSRFSIMTFFYIVFKSQHFRRCLLVIGAATIMWLLATIVVINIQCRPLENSWDPSADQDNCIDVDLFNVLTSGSNVVLNFAIGGLTVPVVLRQEIPKRKKRLIYAGYAIGAA